MIFAYLSLQNGFECTPCARGATNSFPNSKCQPQAPKREMHKMCEGCHNVWCRGVVRPGEVGRAGWAGPGAFAELGIINYTKLELRVTPKLQSAKCLLCVRGATK